MKSRKSSMHDRLNIKNPKITTTKSQSAISNSNRSLTNIFLKKNLTIQNYSNLFGQKVPFHIGDADTLFRKSLRKYNDFNLRRSNTTWIKTKEPSKSPHEGHILRIEYEQAAGDHLINLEEEKVVEDRFNTEKEDSALDLSHLKSPPESPTESNEYIASNFSSSRTTINMAEDGEGTEEIEKAILADNAEGGAEGGTEGGTEGSAEGGTEGSADGGTEGRAEGGAEGGAESALIEGGESDIDADFKKMLDKSLEELKNAVEQLDADALENLSSEVTTKISELEGEVGIKPADAGDSKAVVPFGKDVLAELEKAELQAKSTANVINDLKERVASLLSKEHMTDADAKELEEMNRQLVKHMEEFEATTRLIQTLVNFADQHIKPMKQLPAPQPRQPEDMLPKVIICGTTENNMPKIIICDADKKKKRPRSSKTQPAITGSQGAVVPKIAKRLSDSYDMQEKLAADNMNLEDKRFQLQEELLNKDKTCENLQKKVCCLQGEVRLLAKENTALNDKLAKVQGKCRPKPDMPCGSNRGVCPADVENRLQHYSQTTGALEKQVETMESEVKRMQEELAIVQRERAELEMARKMAATQPPPPPQPQHVCRPTCHGPCRPGAAAEQQLRELREQYNRLQDDYKSKVTEVAGLRADNEKLKCNCKDANAARKMAESKSEEMEREVKRYDDEQKKLIGSKEQLIEQEQQLIVAKQRFREAQDELEEVRALIGDQASQLEDYRNKYLQAQQQVEEQRRQIDMMEMENNRVSEQVAVEIQRVKNQFQEKLAELSPLPDILKGTQLKLQEEQQLRMLAERNAEALSRDLQLAKEKEQSIASQIEKVKSDQLMNEDEKATLMSKLEGWECKCNDMQENCDKLKTDLARTEEMANQNAKRLDEKLHEVAQLTAQLETVREESARQVARTKDRCETVRRSMQGQIADLERQLAQARAMARSAQKDRDELRIKMQAQINNLNENFEEAQLRIRSLQGHVNFLKTSYTNVFGGPEPHGANDDGCDCGYNT